jgi:diacylglycerol kinase family enzyme
MPNIAVFANPKSRSNASWDSCRQLLEQRQVLQIFILGEAQLEDQLINAWQQGCKTIVAAGGDGTISSIVDALLRLKLPVKLGVLPIGTFNHFAKDLAIPTDLELALRVIEAGHTTLIDVAKVNERHFINNSSIGLYSYVVNEREGLERRGLHKSVARMSVLVGLVTRRFAYDVRFGTSEDAPRKKISNIFVGNNIYTIEGLSTGTRASLSEGKLFVAIVNSMHGFGIVRFLYKSIIGVALTDKDLNVVGLAECTIESRAKRIRVAYDGETSMMISPLRYRILPKVLSVIVPAS